MNCKDAEALLKEDFDAARENQQLMEHLKTCESCRALYQYRVDARHLDDEEELPADFSSSWRESIGKEENIERSKKTQAERESGRHIGFRRFLSVAAVFVFLIAGTVLTRNGSDENYAEASSGQGVATAFYADADGLAKKSGMSLMARSAPNVQESAALENRRQQKLIRTLNISISTKSFYEDLKKVQESLSKSDGYQEYINIGENGDGKLSASITMRVPESGLDAFVASLDAVGRTVSKTESVQDVSESYYDAEARLKTQEDKMRRLSEMMEKAESVDELIQIESAIADTQYEIDSLNSTIKRFDSDISYSTVNLSLMEELKKDTAGDREASFSERMSGAFSNGLSEAKRFLIDMLVFIGGYFPLIVIIIAIIIIVNAINKKRRNSHEK